MNIYWNTDLYKFTKLMEEAFDEEIRAVVKWAFKECQMGLTVTDNQLCVGLYGPDNPDMEGDCLYKERRFDQLLAIAVRDDMGWTANQLVEFLEAQLALYRPYCQSTE